MNERTAYVILTEWICEWQESVEVTPVAFLDRRAAQTAMQQMVDKAVGEFPKVPTVDQCNGYCELSSEGPYGTDCVKLTVVPIQLPGTASEDVA